MPLPQLSVVLEEGSLASGARLEDRRSVDHLDAVSGGDMAHGVTVERWLRRGLLLVEVRRKRAMMKIISTSCSRAA